MYNHRQKSIFKQIYNGTIKTFGVALVGLFFALYYAILYSLIFDTIYIYHVKYQNYFISLTLLSIGLFLAFNLIFNYFMVIYISPGLTSEVFTVPKNPAPEIKTPFVYDPSKCQFNKSQLRDKLDSRTLGYCNKCQLPKPQRAHHCSICNKCILKMDHHCPWINQCVGLNNQRYFLLFLVYVIFGTLFCSILNAHIYLNLSDQIQLASVMFNIVMPLDLALCLVITAFSSWNWYLAMKGVTSIEYWDHTPQPGQRLKNLQVIFGDVKNWLQILAPSLRDLPINGVIWKLGEEYQTLSEIDEEAIQL